MAMVDITNMEDFNNKIISNDASEEMKVVYFDDSSSRICKAMKKQVDRDKNLLRKAPFYRVDLFNKKLEPAARRFMVETYPTFVLVKKGGEVEEGRKYVGIDKRLLESMIDKRS